MPTFNKSYQKQEVNLGMFTVLTVCISTATHCSEYPNFLGGMKVDESCHETRYRAKITQCWLTKGYGVTL